MSPSPAPAFSVTEMLTTAGVTFLTSGAKLGSCTAGADCVSGAGWAVSAKASGAKAKPKPTLVARAAARTRRKGDIAFGREIWESMLNPLRRGCGGVTINATPEGSAHAAGESHSADYAVPSPGLNRFNPRKPPLGPGALRSALFR